jgi:hypothetical protein
MTTEAILDRLAKGTPPFRKDLGTFVDHRPAEKAEPGQIWSIRTNRHLPNDVCKDGWFFICKRHDKLGERGVNFTVAPLFEDVSYAHDRDAILPSRLLGFAAGIAMEMSLVVDSTLLDSCVTSLPEEFAISLMEFYEHVMAPKAIACPTEVSRGLPLIEGLRAKRDRFHEDLSEELEFLRPVESFDGSIKHSSRGLRLWLRTEHPGLLPNGPFRVTLDGALQKFFGDRWISKLRSFGNSIECVMAPDKEPNQPQPLWAPDPQIFQSLLNCIGLGDRSEKGREFLTGHVELRQVSGVWTFRTPEFRS